MRRINLRFYLIVLAGLVLLAGLSQFWPPELTAYDDDPYVRAVLQAGANGYVLKTASPDEIIQAVRDVHAGKSVLDPDIAQKLITQTTQPPAAPPVESLTNREREVLTLVGKGYTNKAIAVQLGISDRTVQGHLANIFTLQAASRTEAVMRAAGDRVWWAEPAPAGHAHAGRRTRRTRGARRRPHAGRAAQPPGDRRPHAFFACPGGHVAG